MTAVTFTTDFGTADGYPGAMKGVVLSLAPSAVLVDITHDIPRHDIAAGAFALAQAAPLFPPGTVHVAVVDPGVGSTREAVVVEAHGAYFVGPDNGLLALAAREARAIHRIERPGFRREPVSPTFHGRDVFAQTAGRLARGERPEDAGAALARLQGLAGAPDEPAVIHVDAFGNLVTSLPAHSLVPGPALLTGGGRSFALPAARTYTDVAPGQLLAYAGSAGLVEIAVREGSAAAITGLARGSRLRLEARS